MLKKRANSFLVMDGNIISSRKRMSPKLKENKSIMKIEVAVNHLTSLKRENCEDLTVCVHASVTKILYDSMTELYLINQLVFEFFWVQLPLRVKSIRYLSIHSCIQHYNNINKANQLSTCHIRNKVEKQITRW